MARSFDVHSRPVHRYTFAQVLRADVATLSGTSHAQPARLPQQVPGSSALPLGSCVRGAAVPHVWILSDLPILPALYLWRADCAR